MASRIKKPETSFSLDKPRRQTRGRKPLKLEEHRAWIRKLPGLVDGDHRTVEAAHISVKDARFGKPSRGKSQKSDDIYLVPLSKRLHMEIHQIGEPAFEDKYGVDLVLIAVALFVHHINDDEEAALAVISRTWEGRDKS